jgi:hypothetical protein
VIVSVDAAPAPTDEGAKLPVAPLGNPPTLSAIAALKPPVAAVVTV